MERIDSAIERQFARLLHWIQRITGFTSFRVSHQLALVVALDGFCQVADYWIQSLYHTKTDAILVIICCFTSLVWVGVALICDRLDAIFRQNPKNLPMLFLTPAALRLGIMVISFFSASFAVRAYVIGEAGLIEFLNFLGPVCMWAFYYTAAIPPLPPSESKVRAWLKSFRTAPAMKPAESVT